MDVRTKCARRLEGTSEIGRPIAPAIVPSSTFDFVDQAAVDRYYDHGEQGFLYSRYGNPTVRQAERFVAALEEAEDAARRAVAADRSFWSGAVLAETLLHLDRYDEAEALAREAVGDASSSTYRGRATRTLGLALLYQGRRREAMRTLDHFAAERHGKELAAQVALLGSLVGDAHPDRAREAAQQLARSGRSTKLVPMLLATTGDLAGAAERARDLAPGPPRALYEASVAARGGDLPSALSLVEPALRTSEPQVRSVALWVAAHWALEAGRPADARAHLEAFRRIPSDLFRAFAYPRSLLVEAEAFERLGDRPRARERVDRLLALWKRADPDLALLAEAKALRARLGGGPPPSR